MKLKEWDMKLIFAVFFLVFVVVVIYLPSFKLNFSLLDDGLTILNAKLLVVGIKNIDLHVIYGVLFEPFNGRVRPGYWLVQSLFAYLSLYNSHLFHVLRVLLLVSTLSFGFVFLNKLRVYKPAIYFALLVFVFNIQNFENYYRLGPVEPLIIFIEVVLYLLIFFGKEGYRYTFFLIGVLTILGGLIKENFFLVGVSLIPIIILTSFKNDKWLFKKALSVLVYSLFSGGLIFLVKHSYPSGGVYSSNYIFNIVSITNNLVSYLKMVQFSQSPLFEISIIYLIFKIVMLAKRKFKNITTYELVFVALWSEFVIQLVALSPWSFVLNRYLSFLNINMVFVYALTISDILVLTTLNNKKLWPARVVITIILLSALFTKIFIRNFFNIANYQLYAATDSTISYESVKQIASVIPVNSTVFVNYKKGDSNIEIYEETKWHLKLFYNRNDIVFQYLDDTNLCTKVDRFIFDRRSDRFTSDNVFKDKTKYSPIANGNSVYKPINYGVVLRSFMDRYKYLGWSDSYNFDWSIYRQKGGTCVEKAK